MFLTYIKYSSHSMKCLIHSIKCLFVLKIVLLQYKLFSKKLYSYNFTTLKEGNFTLDPPHQLFPLVHHYPLYYHCTHKQILFFPRTTSSTSLPFQQHHLLDPFKHHCLLHRFQHHRLLHRFQHFYTMMKTFYIMIETFYTTMETFYTMKETLYVCLEIMVSHDLL